MTGEPFDQEAAIAWVSERLQSAKRARTAEASRTLLSQMIYDAIRNESDIEAAVGKALAGDPYIDRAIRQVARDYLATDAVMPPALRSFVSEALWREGPPSFPAGQHEFNHFARNMVIRAMVQVSMKQWDLPKTVNEATDRPSACSVVAEACVRSGIKLSASQVAKIAA